MSAHGSTRVVMAALIVNVSIVVVKAAAAAISGSAAMLAETVHSFVDCGNQILLLVGIKRSARAPDARHPLGYHRELYFWSFVVAVALFLGGGVASIYEGIGKMAEPEHMSDYHVLDATVPGWIVNVGILVVSGALEAKGFSLAWQELRARAKGGSAVSVLLKSTDPGLFVVMFEDGAALLGLAIAAIATLAASIFDMPWLDGAASVAIGVMLLGVALVLGNETRSLLVGESSPRVAEFVREQAAGLSGVVNINEIVTECRGPTSVIVLLSLDWQDDMGAGAIEQAVSGLERSVKARFPEVTRMFIEAQGKAQHDADLAS